MKSLFNISDIDQSGYGLTANSSEIENRLNFSLFRKKDQLNRIIGTLKKGTTKHYVSAADWSMHDLLFYILDQTGPAKVYISTWSISESPVRMLLDGMESGLITQLNCLFDVRVKVQTPEVYHFLKFNISNIKLSICHAKVTVIENDDWAVTIIGSANYTHNPRIEAGVICCDRRSASFHKQWIMQELSNANPFE